jgi:hypothetical protein
MEKTLPVNEVKFTDGSRYIQAQMHVSADEVDVMESRAHLNPLTKPWRRNANWSWVLPTHRVLVQDSIVESHFQFEREIFWHVSDFHATFVVEEEATHAAAADALLTFAGQPLLNCLNWVTIHRWDLRFLQKIFDSFSRLFVSTFTFQHR